MLNTNPELGIQRNYSFLNLTEGIYNPTDQTKTKHSNNLNVNAIKGFASDPDISFSF